MKSCIIQNKTQKYKKNILAFLFGFPSMYYKMCRIKMAEK